MTGLRFRNYGDGTAPTILIGGVAATNVVVVSATEITFDAPAASETGTVDVTITTEGGSFTLVGGFTYYASAITAVEPPWGPIAGATAVVIRGFNFVTGSTVTFDGELATDVVFIDEEHIACVTPAHAVGPVDVMVEEPGGYQTTLVNGFTYTLLIRGEDFRRMGVSIRDVLNNAPNSATFSIDGTSTPPTTGEQIEIVDPNDGDRLLFRGILQGFDQEYEGQTDQLVYRCTAVDFTWLLNRRRPLGKYVNVSASDIVNDLLAKYAPAFGRDFVQTNLAPVSAEFDGTMDFASVLSEIARAIGGGHWYVDYDMGVHFFHVPPPIVTIPVPTSPGPGTAITLTQDGPIGTTESFSPGYYYVRSTFLYSNGVESRLGPVSAVVAFDGTHFMQMDDIPLGSDPGGGITCVGRRIYYVRGARPLTRGWKINDNTTTSITVFPGGLVAAPIEYEGNQGAIINGPTDVPPTPASITAPSVVAVTYGIPEQNSGLEEKPVQFVYGTTWQFQVSTVYADGNESLPSPFSNAVTLGANGAFTIVHNLPSFTSMPTFPTVNGVAPALYRIYAKLGPAPVGSIDAFPELRIPHLYAVLPYGDTGEPETTDIDYGVRPRTVSTDVSTTWPNPDGPYLEDTDPPDEINDANEDLLRDIPFKVNRDSSQVRNRVIVLGAGTVTTADAFPGDSQLQVADCSKFTESGGEIVVNGKILVYFGAGTNDPGPGPVFLTQAITDAIPVGSAVRFYLAMNDPVSQEIMGRIELDSNGDPTDGIHETVISDDSLYLPQQLYMRANAELELFSRPIVSINYSTRDPKTKSGQKVTVNLTNPPCTGEFLIQDVTIDQIHDESDTLDPRYTVNASSVKFDLEDLLMMIGPQKAGSGGAAVGTGLVGAGVGSSSGGTLSGEGHPQGLVSAPVGSVYMRTNGYRYLKQGGGTTRFGWYLDSDAKSSMGLGPMVVGYLTTEAVAITGTGGPINMSAWANTNPGTPAYVTVNNKYYRRFDSSAVINTVTYVNNGTAFSTSLFDRPFDAVARIAIADISTMRIFFAISTAAPVNAANIVANATPAWYTAIGYRSDQGEGGWIGMTKNGANNLSNTENLASISGGTTGAPVEATLRMRWFPASGDLPERVFFSVNDGEEIEQRTNVPSGEPSIPAIYFGGVNLAASQRFFFHRALLVAIGD
jgi:hypothetical protein